MTVVEFNLKGYGRMSNTRVDADVRKVDDLASLYLWQEAGWHYAPNITRLMPDHEHVFLGGSTAISLDPEVWRIVSGQRRPLHYGVPGVCDRRWITEVIATRNGATVAIGSGHWAPKRGGLGIPAQRRGNANAKAWIARHVAAGRPGILGFDANQKNRFLGEEIGGQRLRYVRDPDDPIIGFVLWGSETHGWSTGAVPRGIDGVNSDHRPWLGDFDLFRKKATMDRFITKEQWGSNQSKEATEDSHPIGSTRGITAHWEGTHVPVEDHSRCAQRVRDIERSHEYGRGWGDIAYNMLVCQHGYVFEGRGANVRSAANGYSAVNADWYAVCYLGGPTGVGFTDEGRDGYLWSFDYLTREGDAGPLRNGHRDHKATACPGDDIYEWVHSPAATNQEDDVTPDQLLDALDSPRGRKILGEALIEARIDPGTGSAPGPASKAVWTVGQMLAHDRKEADTIREEIQS